MADLEELDQDEPETKAVSIDDLVVVAEFKDTIYPGLVETGRVQRGGDKPFHTVINAENYHALETLPFTHRGKSTPSTSTRHTTRARRTGSTTTTTSRPTTTTATPSGSRSWSDG